MIPIGRSPSGTPNGPAGSARQGDAEEPGAETLVDGGEQQSIDAIAASISQNFTGQLSAVSMPNAILSGWEYRSR